MYSQLHKPIDLTHENFISLGASMRRCSSITNSLRKDCLKIAELVYQIDRKLNNEIRPIMKNKQYPRFLKDHEDKDVFIQWLKNDEGIKTILHDVSSRDERKNLFEIVGRTERRS